MATALQLTICVFLILIWFYPTLMSITVMSARTTPAESISPTAPFHDSVGVPWQSSMAESLFQPNLAKSLFQQMFDSSFSTWNDDPSTFFAPADASIQGWVSTSIQGWVSTSITPIQGIFSFNYLRKLPFGTQIKNMSKVYLSILSNIDGFRSDIEVPYHAGPTAPFPDLVDLPLPGISPMAESKDSSSELAQAEAAIYAEDRAISIFLKPILTNLGFLTLNDTHQEIQDLITSILTNTEPEQLQFVFVNVDSCCPVQLLRAYLACSEFQIWRFCSPDRLLMDVDLVQLPVRLVLPTVERGGFVCSISARTHGQGAVCVTPLAKSPYRLLMVTMVKILLLAKSPYRLLMVTILPLKSAHKLFDTMSHWLRTHWFSETDSADSPFQIWRAAQLECA